ncbi:MAG TPA: hypothetical protein P5114_05800, partial [Hyphomicrobiaceae bacterium]|nr:hypothetical protein [Hyphomicrobiaceae bacterium]
MTEVLSNAGAPALAIEYVGSVLTVRARGNWTLAHVDEMEKLVEATALALKDSAVADLDMQGVGALDTYGSLLLLRLVRKEQAAGKTMPA